MITMSKLGQMGRLGNQLWQIATMIGYANEHKVLWAIPEEYKSPTCFFPFPLISERCFSRLEFQQYKETSNKFNPIPKLPYPQNINIDGFFQSHKYFEKHNDCIKRWFTPKPDLVYKLKEKYPEYFEKGIQTIALHIRRTDFENEVKGYYNYLSVKYYREAAGKIASNIPYYHYVPVKILYFSDDIEWVKANLPTNEYIEGNTAEEDLILMSYMKNHVIANSSFSWWGAYIALLNNRTNLVVSPGGPNWSWFGPKREKDWRDTSDLIPNDPKWIAI